MASSKSLVSQFLRTTLAALLKEGFTVREMRELARELRGPLSYELSDMLDDMAMRLGRFETVHHTKNVPPSFSELADKADRQGFPKSEVYEMMTSVAPALVPKSFAKFSVSRMIAEFVERASESQVRIFERKLSSALSDDPFLRGITKRNS